MTMVVLAVGAFFAGLLKVGFGQGAGIFALPICTLVVQARFANGVLAPLLSLNDVISIPAYWRRWDTRLLAAFLPGQFAGVAAGAWALSRMSDAAARRSIGALLVVAVALQLWERSRAARAPVASAAAPAAGPQFFAASLAVSFVAGFASSLAQLGSGFLSLYLVRLGTAKTAIVPTLNLTFFFTNLLKIGLYMHYGLITTDTWIADAWLAPIALAGGFAGVAANRRLSQRAFENALLAFALISGAALLFK